MPTCRSPEFNGVRDCRAVLLMGFLLVVAPAGVQAYVGPGAGLSVVGIVLGLIAAVFFGIVGFVWYPVSRFLRGRRQKQAEIQSKREDSVEGP